MGKITRREFLTHSAKGLGVILLGQVFTSCRFNKSTPAIDVDPTSQSDITQNVAPTSPNQIPIQNTPDEISAATPANTSSPTQQEARSSPQLVVARGPEPEALVRQAMNALGGMDKFVKPGMSVIIKPNICVAYNSYEYAATTNPWVVGALVKLSYEAGAKSVKVMDYPFGGTPQQAYASSGIEEQVIAAGGEMVVMPAFKFIPTDIPNGIDLKQSAIFDDVLQTDILINVPIAKHHGLARLTLGMKNLMGVIHDRQTIHRNIGQRLADLTSRIYPTLTVIDAVRILTANGPTGGNLDDVKKMDTIIASNDIVAADSYASTLFGLNPVDLSYIVAGKSMGLGENDLNSVDIEEITVDG